MLAEQHYRTAVAALLVGLIWGCTNPFIRRGSLEVEAAQAQQQGGSKAWQAWFSPAICVPWLCNQLGSVLFVVLLGQADISMSVPVANAVSIAANALVSGLCRTPACGVPGHVMTLHIRHTLCALLHSWDLCMVVPVSHACLCHFSAAG